MSRRARGRNGEADPDPDKGENDDAPGDHPGPRELFCAVDHALREGGHAEDRSDLCLSGQNIDEKTVEGSRERRTRIPNTKYRDAPR